MAGLTVRQQMVKGSKWKVKTDFSTENHLGAEWKWVPAPTPTNPRAQDIVQTKKKITDFKAGEILTVTGKTTNYPPSFHSEVKGIFVPMEVEGRKGQGSFLLSEIQPHLELELAIEQEIFVFHSASLGYISSIPWQYEHYQSLAEWQKTGEDHIPEECKVEHLESLKTGGILFTDKLTKAMKKKRSQDTKQFLLSHSGYYDDIDTDHIYYVFEPGGKKVDFPDDLEIQTLDKATKTVKETFKASEYLKGAFRLRPLTIKYGSSIRAVFKEMEEKGKDFATLLMFQDTDEDITTYDKSKPLEELKKDFKDQKFDKSTYIMKSDFRTVSFAFKNRNDALMFKLAYTGTLESRLVDSQTLDDVKATA